MTADERDDGVRALGKTASDLAYLSIAAKRAPLEHRVAAAGVALLLAWAAGQIAKLDPDPDHRGGRS